GLGIALSLLNSLIFFAGITFIPENLMRLYSKDELVIIEGIKYLKIIAPAYFVISFIMAINASLKATRNTAYPMITTFISLLTNIILNYVFIFKMNLGVKGAAIATLCARIIELISQILIVYLKKLQIIASIKDYFSFNKEFVTNYFVICTPVILNEIFWSVGVAICNMAYKYSGTNAQAAVQITGTIQNLFTVVGVAIGGGCGILLSNALGSGNEEMAINYSKKCMILTIMLSTLMSLFLLIVSPYIVSVFKITDIVRDYAIKLLYVVAFGMIFKTFNYTTIVGVLRSGGDTKYTLLLDFLTVWLIGIPMAFLGSYFLNLPIYITYAMVYSEEIVKGFFSFFRVKKQKWVNTLVG
ncbi:MAG: MATE family efflux transporter, partial [Eubacteriales bacterium]|nr:MATE family efflux transporter [Eubacteriales bacterium]